MPRVRNLSRDELVREWRARPGLMPVFCAPDRPLVVWCDAGESRFTQPFFADFLAQVNDRPDEFPVFATEPDALDALDPGPEDTLPVHLVFHSGRCGSTLLARALTRWPASVVLSEPQPLNDVWWRWTDGWRDPEGITDERLGRFARLVALMARRRSPEQEACIIKLSSWSTVLADALMSALPEAPSVYLYRDPLEVMVSLTQRPPGWLKKKDTPFGAFIAGRDQTQDMDDAAFMAGVLARGMRSALDAGARGLRYLNYRDLKADAFGEVLESALGLEPGAEALEAMGGQFGEHAKDTGGRPFRDDSAGKREAADDRLRALVERELAPHYEALESRAAAAADAG